MTDLAHSAIDGPYAGHPVAPRVHRDLLPPSGAWTDGDPVGDRKFVAVSPDRPFVCEGGGQLRDVVAAYESWGTLNADHSNAVLICHALTGDSHAAGRPGPGHPGPGWWNSLIGPGKWLDTKEWFVVCVNVLGGCQGSTGPASTNPATGEPYGPDFPTVTIRDMVRCQRAVQRSLDIDAWASVIGGSMGGMQVLEWGVMYPEAVRSLIPLASTCAASAQQIAFGCVGRNAIRLDPKWRDGRYYDAAPGDGPHEGLGVARMVSQITYRSEDVFTDRFGREMVDQVDGFTLWQRFQVERYLEYHADKLARRFDANSYLVLTKAMDLHDIARGRGGLDAALRRLRCPVRVASITTDMLYPPHQQYLTAETLAAVGGTVDLVDIDSPHGHDAFLINIDQVGPAISSFLARLFPEIDLQAVAAVGDPNA